MKIFDQFNSKNSHNLFGMKADFELLKKLYEKDKLPRVLMLSGKKGIGKSTLINHLMYFIFDRKNYNEKKNEFKINSLFHQSFLNDIFENIIYLTGNFYRNIKIEDIRKLKRKILQTSLINKPRFIIMDDVEVFNNNSLNALLKFIEEPNKNNYFLLINNETQPLIETIKSRCLEIKIILNENERIEIINSLINKFKFDSLLNAKQSQLSPGFFLLFNLFLAENNISLKENYIINLTLLLDLYKKNKNSLIIALILFLTDNYFKEKSVKNPIEKEKIFNQKLFILENINKYFLYNINQNSLINAVSNKINDE